MTEARPNYSGMTLAQVINLSNKELKEAYIYFSNAPVDNMRNGNCTYKQIFEACQNELQRRATESLTDEVVQLQGITDTLNKSSDKTTRKVFWQGWFAIGISTFAHFISIIFAVINYKSDYKWQQQELFKLDTLHQDLAKKTTSR